MACRDSGISLPLDHHSQSESDSQPITKPPERTSSRQWTTRRRKDSKGPPGTEADEDAYDRTSELRMIYSSFWNHVGTMEASVSNLKDNTRKTFQHLSNLQLYDMSASVYQELSKRENRKLTWLPTWMSAPSTRSQSRNHLPKLDLQQFERLVGDLVNEIDRRFPDFVSNQKQPPENKTDCRESMSPAQVHLLGTNHTAEDRDEVVQVLWRSLLPHIEIPNREDINIDSGCIQPTQDASGRQRSRNGVEVEPDEDYVVLSKLDTTNTDSAPGSKRSSLGTEEKQKLRMSGNLIIPNLTTSIEDLDKNVVADGGFSSVYIAKYQGEKVAVKVLRVTRDSVDRIRRRLNREILIWSQLNHPNVTPLLGVAHCGELSSLQAMVTPWYEHGSAPQYLAKNNPSTIERLELATGVADGLQYLHKLLPVVVHADLKPNNILIDDQRRPRICDFGLSQMINEEAGSGFTTTTPHTGNARYAAHEIIFQEEGPFAPSTASDVFSLGCVIYEFITGCLPYSKCSNLMQIVGAVARGRKPATRPVESIGSSSVEGLSWDLFQQCWRAEPQLRPRADEVWRRLQVIASVGSGWSPPIAAI